MRPLLAAALLILVPVGATADTLYRCIAKDGTIWTVNAARRYSGFVEFRSCKPLDLRPHVDPAGARCQLVRFRNTTFRRCEKDGLVIATSIVEVQHVAKKASGPAQKASGGQAASQQAEPVLEAKARSNHLDQVISEAAAAFAIPEALLRAVIMVESGFRADVVSPAGAQGLMQLMPVTASELDLDDPFDPRENVMAGARLLRKLSDRFNGDAERVVAAYFSGPTAVARTGGIPTQACASYVSKVLSLYRKYSTSTDRQR